MTDDEMPEGEAMIPAEIAARAEAGGQFATSFSLAMKEAPAPRR